MVQKMDIHCCGYNSELNLADGYRTCLHHNKNSTNDCALDKLFCLCTIRQLCQVTLL